MENHTKQTEEQKRNQRSIDLMFKNHLQMTWRIFGITGGSLVVFGGGGYMLDTWLNTKPVFMIIGFILAFIASQVINFVVFNNITKK